ncbi:MAG: 30S ribosomal protein S17 [Microgenomates bacterium OLB22]|nr:MAG: 30S ribosomal protein S17 [Microgenomates bacterium OLB22]
MAKTLTGTVVSMKMTDTVVVRVERAFQHKLYEKTIKRHKKYLAGSNGVEMKEGDSVQIKETRPLSRHKHFIVVANVTK